VNKKETQNSQQHHFPEPLRKGGLFWTNWPTEVVQIAKLQEFDEIDKLFTTSCDQDMGHTLRLKKKHISP
jgi:hypothetical protein